MSKPVSRLNDASMAAHVPAEIRSVLGKPALLANEDQNQYDALMVELAHEVNPTGVVEWLWVKDIADLTFDILRYRRIKASRVNDGFRTSFVDRLSKLLEEEEFDREDDKAEGESADRDVEDNAAAGGSAEADSEDDEVDSDRDDPVSLADQWSSNKKTKRIIDNWFKQNGYDTEAMVAESFLEEMGAIEAIERMLASAEIRRNNALREIERRHAVWGHGLRQASDRIIEGAASLVPDSSVTE